MIKIILMLIFFAISSGVTAEWIQITKSGEGIKNFINVYADFDTIRKIGNKAKMWVQVDCKIIEKEYSVTSVKQREEYDCKEKTQWKRFIVFYTENMGKGEIVFHKLTRRHVASTPG